MKITIRRDSSNYAAGGGVGAIEVIAQPLDTPWVLSNVPDWIAVIGPLAGRGPGSVVYRVRPNVSARPRTGIIGIAGSRHTVTQAAADSEILLDPSATAVPSVGGEVTVTVQVRPADVEWEVLGLPAWVTAAATRLSGTQSITLLVDRNEDLGHRTCILEIGGQKLMITQAGLDAVQQPTVDMISFEYSTRVVEVLPNVGVDTVGPNGTIRSTGPLFRPRGYAFPYVILDTDRLAAVAHPAAGRVGVGVEITAPETSVYSLTYSFGRANTALGAGDGVWIVGWINGDPGRQRQLFSRTIGSNVLVNAESLLVGPTVVRGRELIEMRAGEKVQMVVFNGPDFADATFDATAFEFSLAGAGAKVSSRDALR